MSNLPEIFRLKGTPSGPMEPWEAVTTTWRLLGDGQEYILEITCRLERKPKTRRVAIGPRRAARWLKAIADCRLTLPPASSPSCGGTCYELGVGDTFASVKLTWLNVPPEGAEPLKDLVEWLSEFVTPELYLPEKECLEMQFQEL